MNTTFTARFKNYIINPIISYINYKDNPLKISGILFLLLILLSISTTQAQCGSEPFPNQWTIHELESTELPYRSVYLFADTDIDSDGKKDIVTGGWWYKNPGTASGNWIRKTIGGTFKNMAYIHDFDGDGDPDLLGTTGAYRGADLVWAQNDGAGNFTIRTNIPSGNTDYWEPFLAGIAGANFQSGGPFQMAINWNGAESTNSPVQILTVPADPVNNTWSLVDSNPDSLGEDMQAGDIDDDGDIDLFQSSNWLRNEGNGSFTTFDTGLSYVTTPDRAQLSDFDGDGDLDAVVGQLSIGTSNANRFEFSWWEAPSNPTQTWERHILATDINGSLSVHAEDIDKDGDDDIIVGEWQGDNRLIAFENDLCDSGTFIRHELDAGGTGFDHHDSTRVVDIDGDGDFDVISIGWDNIVPRIFENTSTTSNNEDPVSNAGSNKSITLPTNTITINGTGNDPDGGNITFSWSQTSGPSSANLTNASTANLTANNLVEGTYIFRLTVTDDENDTDTDEISVSVNPEQNTDIPLVNAGSNQNIKLPTNTITLSGSGSDPDGGTVSFLWSQISGPNTALLDNANTTDLTANNLIEGSYVFQLTATDDESDSASDNVSVVVSPQENTDIPVVNAGGDQNIMLPNNSITLSGTGSDPDGGTVTFAWTQISGPNTALLDNANTAAVTASSLIEGSYVFQLTGTDDESDSTSDDVTVVVTAQENTDIPIINAGTDQDITLPTNSIILNGSGSDPDGGTVSFLWEQISGPNTTLLTNSNSADVSVSSLIEGSYIFRLTGTDDESDSTSDEVTVVVSPESSSEFPIANAGSDLNITLPNNTITLNGSGNDPDGGAITFLWTQTSGPSSAFLTNINTADLTVNELIVGTYVFRLTITDDEEDTAFDETSVFVSAANEINQEPIAVLDTDIISGPNPLTVNFTGSNSTDDGTITTYSWDFGNGETSLLADPSYTYTTTGTFEVNLTVTDSNGLSNTTSTNITVTAPETINEESSIVLETNPAKEGTARIILLNKPNGTILTSLYLHDSAGRIIKTFNAQTASTGNNTYEFSIITLRDGLYYISMDLNNGEYEALSLMIKN
ncbi:PKD domain-containing protein [Aurantibacter sp.]|uniref:PKD domain-containing protein n=1 Tax=Aurantibacter sp. TaxID=2807103 RepID=UPI00326749BB